MDTKERDEDTSEIGLGTGLEGIKDRHRKTDVGVRCLGLGVRRKR